MSGGNPNRFVVFAEVVLEPQGWSGSGEPDNEGFATYTHSKHDPYSTVTITRSDGKVLSFEVRDDSFFKIRENVIRFPSSAGMHSDEPFH
jgi:hypothetical protein